MAFVAFFVAFHPGGIKLADGTPAQNPRDVILYLIQKMTGGFGTGGGSDFGGGNFSAQGTGSNDSGVTVT
jgi:uncharacterized spore protein YtfJ